MEMLDHTPGTWVAAGGWVENIDDSVPDVCVCEPELFEQGHMDYDRQTIYKNAQLISAAPELFTALKMLLDMAWECGEGQYDEYMQDYLSAEGIFSQARDALAKAGSTA